MKRVGRKDDGAYTRDEADPPAGSRNFPEPAAKKAPRHVLVVDDEPLICWSVSESLTELGLDVEQAQDAASALRAVTTAAEPFDIVVLDFRLPDMSDLSLLSTLRQLLPRAKLVLMTAHSTNEIMSGALALGASVLAKPFELGDLIRLVCGLQAMSL